MVGWDTLYYDSRVGKWFEWIQYEFSHRDDGDELLAKEEAALWKFRYDNLDRCAQQSVLMVTAGKKAKIWSCLQVTVEEFRPYERRCVGCVIDEYSEKHLMEAQQFVEQWHCDSETRYPHICYSGFFPAYQWEVDPISIPPDPAYVESDWRC